MSIYRHMDCPKCSSKLKTVNSRKTAGGASTWRRKHCPKCDLTLSSRENLDLSPLLVIDGRPYSRASLIARLARLSSKTSEEVITNIVDTIEGRLLKLIPQSPVINQRDFNKEVLLTLKKLDRAAYFRYKAEVEES
jgi:transcriptional regulator NrdR family protein